MSQLSQAGQQIVQEISARYNLSPDAVTHMLYAVYKGNGSMAQFSHPEFGGSGQWMRGGMTMVSDLFNNQLKMLVDNVCNDLSNALANHQTAPFAGSFQSQSQSGFDTQSQAAGQIGINNNSLFVPDPAAQWWPHELGTPTAIGSQNNMKYAYFANSRRLAVTTGGKPWIYDTLDHQIGGFGQQQGGGSSITFTSQYGTVNLSSLPVLSRDGAPVQPPQFQPPPSISFPSAEVASGNATGAPSPAPTTSTSEPTDVIATLEKLGQLRDKGYISDEEFNSKKADLLSRL
ncbi:MAG: SHOCT domain-containing protein [Hyphomicrobiaceae bacterium]|nr:SHOCT domain-containing protein [Hyphomicrobiaceae bacterium]